MQATQRAVNRKISKRPVFFVVTTDRLTDEFPELKVRQKPAEEKLNENIFHFLFYCKQLWKYQSRFFTRLVMYERKWDARQTSQVMRAYTPTLKQR